MACKKVAGIMVCVIQKILIGKMHQSGSKSVLFAICRGFARGVMNAWKAGFYKYLCKLNLMVHS